jgi:hypothetical protein
MTPRTSPLMDLTTARQEPVLTPFASTQLARFAIQLQHGGRRLELSSRLGPEPIDFEIRPRFGSFVGQHGARLAAGGALVLIGIASQIVRLAASPSSRKVSAAAVLLLVVILAIIAAGYASRARIVVAGETVTRSGWRVRRFARSDVTGVVACRDSRTNRLLGLKGRDDDCLLCLYTDYWAETDLQAFLIRLSQPVPDSYEAPCSPATLRRLFPGQGLPLVVARPALFAILLSPIVVVLIVLLVQLVAG